MSQRKLPRCRSLPPKANMAELMNRPSKPTTSQTVRIQPVSSDGEYWPWKFWSSKRHRTVCFDAFLNHLERCRAGESVPPWTASKWASQNVAERSRAQSTAFSFLSLPPKIRTVVYGYTIEENPVLEQELWFEMGRPIAKGHFKDLEYSHHLICGILCVNRQLHEEARAILFQLTTIFIVFQAWNRKSLIDVLQTHSLRVTDLELVPELYIKISGPGCSSHNYDSPRLQLLINSMSRMLLKMPKLKNLVLDIKARYQGSRPVRNSPMIRLFSPHERYCRAVRIWVPVQPVLGRLTSNTMHYHGAIGEAFNLDRNSPAFKR